VPEDSVRPETQTLVALIRRKGCVGCFESILFRLTTVIEICRLNKMLIEARIIRRLNRIILSVGIKSLNIKGNTKRCKHFSHND